MNLVYIQLFLYVYAQTVSKNAPAKTTITKAAQTKAPTPTKIALPGKVTSVALPAKTKEPVIVNKTTTKHVETAKTSQQTVSSKPVEKPVTPPPSSTKSPVAERPSVTVVVTTSLIPPPLPTIVTVPPTVPQPIPEQAPPPVIQPIPEQVPPSDPQPDPQPIPQPDRPVVTGTRPPKPKPAKLDKGAKKIIVAGTTTSTEQAPTSIPNSPQPDQPQGPGIPQDGPSNPDDVPKSSESSSTVIPLAAVLCAVFGILGSVMYIGLKLVDKKPLPNLDPITPTPALRDIDSIDRPESYYEQQFSEMNTVEERQLRDGYIRSMSRALARKNIYDPSQNGSHPDTKIVF